MTLPHVLRASLIVAALVAGIAAEAQDSVPGHQPTCVNVTLLDAQDLPVKSAKPIIGIMVGGVPAMEGQDIPAHVTARPGTRVPCPPQLIANLQELFNQSCVSEERRKRAALDNKTTVETVVDGCANMRETLTGVPAPARNRATVTPTQRPEAKAPAGAKSPAKP
jgi:hypothetical protein